MGKPTKPGTGGKGAQYQADRPRLGQSVSAKAGPRASNDPESYQSQTISWHLGIVDHGGPYCFTAIGDSAIPDVISKLKSFETMRWSEILNAKNHAISVDKLSKEGKQRLEELALDDVSELISLRFTAKQRVFGIRHGAIFRVLWWDPDHEVCPSALKHT